MSDALRLPDRPNIEFYRKVAKEFQRAVRSTRPGAIREWAADLSERAGTPDVHLARRLERNWNRLVAKNAKLSACALDIPLLLPGDERAPRDCRRPDTAPRAAPRALPQDGQSALHWAAYGGHPDTVRLLIGRGVPVNRTDRTFDGTPLEWALYGWANRA